MPKTNSTSPAAAVDTESTKEETPVTVETSTPVAETKQAVALIKASDVRNLAGVVGEDIRGGTNRVGRYLSTTIDGEKAISYVTFTDRTLDALEAIVKEGMEKYILAGEALLEIRERKLWAEAGYGSFGAYAMDRLGISRPRVYQLIDQAMVAAILTANGRGLPSIASRLSELSILKGDPKLLVAVADKVTETTPTGDLGEAPKGAIKAAVDEAMGKTPTTPAPVVPAGPTNGGDLSATPPAERATMSNADIEAAAQSDDEEEGADDALVATNGTATPAVRRASPAALKPDEKVTPQSLTTVLDALRTGAYVDMAGETKSAIQKLAAMCLSYLAQDWHGAPPKVQPEYVISIAQAKEIVRGLKKAQGKDKAKAALTGEQAAQVAKNEATVAAPVQAEAPEAAPAPEAEAPTTYAANPTTAEEAYAILDANRAWVEAGSKGKRPVTGTQVNRADALLQKLTADETEEDAEEESDEADDIAEAEAIEVEAEEIDLGVVA